MDVSHGLSFKEAAIVAGLSSVWITGYPGEVGRGVKGVRRAFISTLEYAGINRRGAVDERAIR